MHAHDRAHVLDVGKRDPVEHAPPQERVGQLFFVVRRDDHDRPLLRLVDCAGFVDDEAHLIELVQEIVAEVNSDRVSVEQIKKFKVLERDFALELGELTPTMKLRRNRVMEKFAAELDEMYSGH